jgi:type I restriction enzyme S subunit
LFTLRLFKIPPFIDEMNSFTMSLRDGKNIAFSDFGNTYVPVPPIEEQTQIANYLNSKCSEIDSLTDDIQTQITTLEEYKKSLITEVVTKGLDSNVEMKDSGIEWVGEIPASWEIWPIYHYFNERKNKNKLMRETNLLSLSYGNVIRKDINSNGGLLPENFSSYNIIEPCDIVIRPTDLQNDKRSLRTGYVNEHGIITSAYITLKPKMGVNSKYYHYLLHAYDLMKVFYNMGNGVRQGLNYNEFSKLLLISPPKNEQDDIVNYLDSKCSEIDAIIQTKKEQLDVLAEYKKSLIYEYVTGKKEVPVNE